MIIVMIMMTEAVLLQCQNRMLRTFKMFIFINHAEPTNFYITLFLLIREAILCIPDIRVILVQTFLAQRVANITITYPKHLPP